MANEGEQIENLSERLNWHWRNSMRTVRFISFDARAAWPLPLLLIYARWSTLIITIVNLMIFQHLEKKGLSFPAAMRNLRAWIIGKDRPGWVGAYTKKFVDYG